MEKQELLQIVGGGFSITGAVLSSLYKVGSLVFEAGRSLGSALRRIAGGSMCPI